MYEDYLLLKLINDKISAFNVSLKYYFNRLVVYDNGSVQSLACLAVRTYFLRIK